MTDGDLTTPATGASCRISIWQAASGHARHSLQLVETPTDQVDNEKLDAAIDRALAGFRRLGQALELGEHQQRSEH